MDIEWEATFWPIEKDVVRAQLSNAGAALSYPERLMRRVNLYPPDADYANYAWVRVRDEGEKITLTLNENKKNEQSAAPTETIEDIKELEVQVNDFDIAHRLMLSIGCRDKNYQETRRELWTIGQTKITIDEWPFLEPLVEIEGGSEEEVRGVAEALGFDWSAARFCTADKLYAEKYGVESKFVNRGIPRLTFAMENPFQK